MLLVLCFLVVIFGCWWIVCFIDICGNGDFFFNLIGVEGRVFVDCMGGKRGIEDKEFDFRFFLCFVLFFDIVIREIGFFFIFFLDSG